MVVSTECCSSAISFCNETDCLLRAKEIRLKVLSNELGPHFEGHQGVVSAENGFKIGRKIRNIGWHIKNRRLVPYAGCRRTLQEEVQCYRRRKLLQAAQRPSSRDKCRRDPAQFPTIGNAEGGQRAE